MKLSYIIVSVALAILTEWAFAVTRISWTPPLIFFVVILNFWGLRPWQRIWFAFFLGIFLDILYPFPFGTHLIIFLLLGLLIQGLGVLFSNIDSLLTKWIASSFALFLSLSSLYPTGFILGWIENKTTIWDNSAEIAIIIYAFWSLILPLLWFGSANTLKKLRARSAKFFMI